MFWAVVALDASVAANYDFDSYFWDVKFKRSFGASDMVCEEHHFASLDHVFLLIKKTG
jgi:Uri superfamily endonuclease